MEAHRKECPNEVVQCEYHNVGCKERMMHKRKREHEQEKMEEHLSLTKRRLTETYQKLTDTESQLASAIEQINTLMVVLHQTTGHTSHISSAVSVAKWWAKLTAMSMVIKGGDQLCPVIANVTEFSTKKTDKVKWYSDSFYSHDKGYKMCLRVDAVALTEATYMSVYLYLMKGPHDDELTWPLQGKFEVKLLNQIGDCEHHSKILAYDNHTKTSCRVIEGDRSGGWGFSMYFSHDNLQKATPTCQYLKDDCIFLQVSKL